MKKTEICFSNAYFASLRTFKIGPLGKKYKSKEILRDALIENDINVIRNSKFIADFKISEDFLLSGNITSEYYRLQLDSFTLEFKSLHKSVSLDQETLINTFLTVYPELDVATIIFNIHLKKCSTDDMIFISQCFEGSRFNFPVGLPQFVVNSKNEYTIDEISKLYVQKISLAVGNNQQLKTIFKSRCIEIQDVIDSDINDSNEFITKHPQHIYGLLTSDEGWRFVPRNVATEKMALRWRTRNFLYVIPFHRCVLLINFENGLIHNKYKKFQKMLRSKYGYQLEKYFTFKPEIAGLNHGPLLILEIASIHYFLLDLELNKIAEEKPKKLNELLRKREDLISAFSKLSWIKIREMGILGQNIHETMLLSNKTDQLYKRLSGIESALNIKYNQRINFWVINLTIIGVVVALSGTYFSSLNEIEKICRTLLSFLSDLINRVIT